MNHLCYAKGLSFILKAMRIHRSFLTEEGYDQIYVLES